MDDNISLKKATTIYGVAKYSTVLIQLLISAILARLLSPNDYGIVAVVTVFTTLFTTLANLGLGTAVTQYRDLTKQDIQDIFTFSQYFSLGLSLVFALMAYPISKFYDSLIYVPITLLLSISVLFNSLNMIPNAILLKEKRFFKVGFRMIIVTVGSGMLAVIMAYMGAKYYVIVVQSIVSAFLTFIWNFYSSELKIRFRFACAPIKRIKSYSSNQFLYNIANYFAQNLDNILTGKILGNEMLAYYNKGYTLMRYPVTNIAHVITPVLHPILSEYQQNKKIIYDEFMKVAKALSLIGVFITVFCFWADTEIIVCYFGEQWYDAVEPFKWLSACICVQLLNALFGSIYQSLGCTKQMLQSGIVHISISLLAIVLGAYTRSITFLAIFVSISMYIKFGIETIFLIKRSFGFPIMKFLKAFIPDYFIMCVMFAVMFVLGDFMFANLWIGLFVKLAICCIVFYIMLAVTKQLHYITVIIPTKLKNILRKRK